MRYCDDSEPEIFETGGETGKPVKDSAATSAVEKASSTFEFSVNVHQRRNEPPVLLATDTRTGVSEKLWDPNPQFAGIKFGEATVYKWQDKTGGDWTGGALKPPD